MNFDFIKEFPDFIPLYQLCDKAENYVFADATISMTFSRKALEYCVKFIYGTALEKEPCGASMFDMMEDPDFKNYVGDSGVLNEMHYIRKMGNSAVHENNGKPDEAIDVLEALLYVVGELFITLRLLKDYPVFAAPAKEPDVQPRQPAIKEKKEAEAAVEVPAEVVSKFSVSMRHTQFDVRFKRDEEKNRELFIKASLREAGWPIVNVANNGRPFSAGRQIAVDAADTIDYVLYGRDGRPAAVIEYSETKTNPVMGRKKAKRVAAKLEAQFGFLPVIYYTNGYMINVIDQMGYPQRRLFSFHSLPELELMAQQRLNRRPLTNVEIKDEITNREYQKKAINAVCQAFSDMRRGSLIVMATGTGKTRVAISITDVLMRYGWIKNVLFLADRTSLARQAMKNYKKLMPGLTTSLFTGDSLHRDPSARLIFSTYQTMIRLINGDSRTFGIGRFDLIIVDEAHRSVFNKFGMIFRYFDALMLGLTATPKYQQNKSTYEVFRMPKPEPDFAYELSEALKDEYLVGFAVKDRTTAALRRGYKYEELTSSEIQEIEDSLSQNYTQEQVSSYRERHLQMAGYRGYIVNRSTVREMLRDLMDNGLKLQDGTLGKTIIFATNHKEAEVIVEEFQSQYAIYGPDFCKLIDSQVGDRYALIDKLEKRDSGLQIAVSVEMLETGIDIPDLLNLVFFKQTWSKIRFLQMIGRGTRLSADLYGPGVDKKGFLILDYYDNVEFFSTGSTWSTIEGSGTNPYEYELKDDVRSICRSKLSISHYVQTHDDTSEYLNNYREELLNDLITQTRLLDNDDIQVQYNLQIVNKYRVAENWRFLTESTMEEIDTRIFRLFKGDGTPVQVRNFDHIMYAIEEYGLWLAERQPKRGVRTMQDMRLGSALVPAVLTRMMDGLLRQEKLDAVKPFKDDIQAMRGGACIFEDFSVEKVEEMRKKLRDLMVYLPKTPTTYVIDVEDEWIDTGEKKDALGEGLAVQQKSYPEKAMEYLAESEDPEIAKLSNLEPLTAEEKQKLTDIFTKQLGTAVDYAMWSGNMDLLPFLRSKVGINDGAIQKQFGSFFSKEALTPEQYAFMEQIIQYAKVNGDVRFTDLMNVEPFKNVDIMQLFGTPQLAMKVKQMVNTLHNAVL